MCCSTIDVILAVVVSSIFFNFADREEVSDDNDDVFCLSGAGVLSFL